MNTSTTPTSSSPATPPATAAGYADFLAGKTHVRDAGEFETKSMLDLLPDEGDKVGKHAVVPSPLKWHGGKSYLAARIVALMPAHTHYVEPYAGGLSVMLAKNPEGVSEVVNDRHKSLTNFWKVMQNADHFGLFQRTLEGVPFSEYEYLYAEHFDKGDMPRLNMPRIVSTDEIVGKAVNFFIRCRQSLAGRMDAFAPLSRNRVRRGMNEQASAWLSAVEGLPAVHERLKRVVVLNRDALDVIRQQDGPNTLFYLDPPYLKETRATTGEYEHEMTWEQHVHLLQLLAKVQGKFLLSGYRSELYDGHADMNGWHRTEFDLSNHASGGKTKRRMTECLWTNYEPLTATTSTELGGTSRTDVI